MVEHFNFHGVFVLDDHLHPVDFQVSLLLHLFKLLLFLVNLRELWLGWFAGGGLLRYFNSHRSDHSSPFPFKVLHLLLLLPAYFLTFLRLLFLLLLKFLHNIVFAEFKFGRSGLFSRVADLVEIVKFCLLGSICG